MTLIIMCFLALQGSFMSALSPDDIKDTLYEYCPLNNFANRTGDELRSNTTFRPCCVSCVTTDCGVRAPCCPDERITEMTSNCTKVSYRISQKPVWLMIVDPLAYWMVDTCSPTFEDTLEELNCLSRRIDDVFNVSFIQPVIDSNTKIIYANKYCALCNGVSQDSLISNFFQPSVECSFYETTFVSSPLRSLEQSLLDGQCVHYFPPLSSELVYENRCFQEPINECNLTGLWQVYDPVIEEACVSYDLSVINNYVGNYKNIHCFLCNENQNDFLTYYDPVCMEDDNMYFGDRGFMAILSSDRATTNLRLSSFTNACPITEFWDQKKKRCRNIVCPGTKIQTENGCVSLLTSMKNILWSIDMLWIIPAYKQFEIQNLTDWMNEYAFEYIDTNFYSKFKNVTPLTTVIYNNPTSDDELWIYVKTVFEHSRDADDDPANKFIKDIRFSQKDQIVFNANGVNVVIISMIIDQGDVFFINSKVLVFDKQLLQHRKFTYKTFEETTIYVARITWNCDLAVLESDEFSLTLFDRLIVTRNSLHLSPVEYVIDYETRDVLICVEDLVYEGPIGTEMQGVTTSKLLTGLSYGTTIVSMLSIMLVLLTISLNIQRTCVSKLIVGLCLSVVLSQGLQLSSRYVNEDGMSCEILGLLAHFFQINSAAWIMANVVQHVRSKTDLPKKEIRDSSRRFVLLSLISTTLVPSIFVAANVGLSMEVLGSGDLGYGGNYCDVVSLIYNALFSLLPTVFPILFSIILLAWTYYRSMDIMTEEANGKRNLDDKFYFVFSLICLFYWLLKFLSVWFASDDFVNVALVINLAKGMWIFWSFFPQGKKNCYLITEALSI